MDVKAAPAGLTVQSLMKKRTSNVLWIKLNFTVKAARLQTLKRQKYQHLQEEALLKARGLLNNWEDGEVVLTEDLYRRAAGERDAQELMNYTPEALALRFSLRNDPTLLDAVKELWSVEMPRDSLGCIDQKAYTAFFRRIAKTIDSDHFHNKRQHRGVNKAIEDDWKRDAKGESIMSFANFFDSTFELADLWCESIDVDEYVDFLQRIRRRISVPRNGKRVLRPIKQVRPIDDDSSGSESSSGSDEEEAPKPSAKVVQAAIQTSAIVNRFLTTKTLGPTRTATPPLQQQVLRKTNSSTPTAATALKVASGLRAFSARATSGMRPQTPQTPHGSSCSHDISASPMPIASPAAQQHPVIQRERRPSVFGTLQFGEGGRLTIISSTDPDNPDAIPLGLGSFRPSISSAGRRKEAPMMHGITTEVTDRFLTPRERKMTDSAREEIAGRDMELLSSMSQEPGDNGDQGTSIINREWNGVVASIDGTSPLSKPSRVYTVSTAVQKTPAAAATPGGFAAATRSAMAVMRMAASSVARSSAVPNRVDIGPESAAVSAEHAAQSPNAHAIHSEFLQQSGHFARNVGDTIYEEVPLPELAIESSMSQPIALEHSSNPTPLQVLQPPNPIETNELVYADEIDTTSPGYFAQTMSRATPKSLGMASHHSNPSPHLMRQTAAAVREFTSSSLMIGPQSTSGGLSSVKSSAAPSTSSAAAFSTHIKMKTQSNAGNSGVQKKRMLPPMSPIMTTSGYDQTTTLDHHIEELMIGSPSNKAAASARPNASFPAQEAHKSNHYNHVQSADADTAMDLAEAAAPLWFALPSKVKESNSSVRSAPGRMQPIVAVRRARTPTKQQTRQRRGLPRQQPVVSESEPMASPWDSFGSDDEYYQDHGLALKENAYDALAKVRDHETRRSTMAVMPMTHEVIHHPRMSLSKLPSPDRAAITEHHPPHKQSGKLVAGIEGQSKLSGAQSTPVLPSMQDNFGWDDDQLIEIKTRRDRSPQAPRSQTASSPKYRQKQGPSIWKEDEVQLSTWELDASQLEPNGPIRNPLTATSLHSPDHRQRHTVCLSIGERSEIAMRQRVQTAPSSPLFRVDADSSANEALGGHHHGVTMLVNTTQEIILKPRRMEDDILANAKKDLPTRSEMMRRRHKYAFGKPATSKLPKG